MAPFEGTRDALPLAVFRAAFYAGVAFHFFPTLLHLDEAYRPGALRTMEWSETLYERFGRASEGDLHLWAAATMIACVAGLVGVLPRAAAIVTGTGCYVFASFNGLHVQTLALVETWAVFLLWAICGGGTETLSLEAVLRRRTGERAVTPRLLPSLLLFQILLGVFFSGVEKVRAGWPFTNEMGVVLSYPRGAMVRDWVADSAWIRSGVVTHLATWLTLLVELGAPVGLLFRRTRWVAFAAWQAFFLGIIAMLEVPPLFYFTFAAGAVLALDAEDVDALRAQVQRWRARPSRPAVE